MQPEICAGYHAGYAEDLSLIHILRQDIRFITCVFAEVIGDKVVEKGTLAKMARGEMVRYLAKNQVEDMEGIKGFNRLGYHFSQEYSDVDTLVFILKQDRDAEAH